MDQGKGRGGPLLAGDVESIERATVAAVSPHALEEIDGWLLPFDGGTVNRAKSAVPLRHALMPEPSPLIARMEARYAARDLPAQVRLALSPCFDGMRAELRRRGYLAEQPTLVQLAPVATVRAVSAELAEVDQTPDAAWAALFMGEGFDPVDGASRVSALRRAPGSLYASVREDGRTIAAGAAAFSHGWVSVHGMRTAPPWRGRRMAGRILAALADAALARGLKRCFLQVEVGNTAALALYRRAGFVTAWSYEYWRRS
ncbi:MAG: GNAT family N-acetyltransferase [Polaromonas sp.]|nr:GNAT family N-acetyltransferase [Polaromonas sp.]